MSAPLGRRLNRRVFAAVAALVFVLGLVGYVLASSFVYDTLSVIDRGWCPSHFRADTPAAFSTKEMDNTPAVDLSPYAMPDYESVSFPSRGGEVAISGWWVPGRTSDAPAVVIVHGRGKCKHDPEALLPAGMLHGRGFGVLLIDMRNHGDSGGDDGRYAGGVKEYRDVLGGWDWLRTVRGLPPERIGLLGVSLGAGSAMIAMGEEPGVAATWEDSGFADVDVAIQDQLTRRGYPTILAFGGILVGRLAHGVDLTSRSPLKAIAKLNGRPLFVVHGTADTTILVKHADMLVAAIGAEAAREDSWILPGVGHVRAAFVATKEYERRLTGFFASALGPG